MEDTSVKIVKGCGIGCAVVFGLVILVLAIGYITIKNKFDDFKEFEELNSALVSKYGKVEEFKPYTDPDKFAERLERFILIRKELQPDIRKLEIKFSGFESELDTTDKSFWHIFDFVSSGLGLIPDLLNYYKARNDLLFKYEMGLGEYYYNYISVFYSFLNNSPGDGPAFSIANNISVELNEGDSANNGNSVRDARDEKIRKLSNRYFRSFYSNVVQKDSSDTTRVIIIEELNKLKENKFRIPWSDGLPEFLLNTLEVHKNEFDSLYSFKLNPVEMNELEE